MKRTLLLILALLFLFAVEILHVYFIMPFPGSQKADTVELAYFIEKYIWWLRLIGVLLAAVPVFRVYKYGKLWKKVLLSIFLLIFAYVFYVFNFRFLADKMFYQPKTKMLVSVTENKVDSNSLVIGVRINGQAKAYPIELIGYHHQVQDTIGGEPVIVTYCTVCRTGRAYSPFVNGQYEQFRLVGMDHFNAMFEDSRTKSWWQQATGRAIAGPLKGTSLKEIPTEQMRLAAWVRHYPNTLVMQPDPLYTKQYQQLKGFDVGTIESGLEKRDSAAWQFKSWVVGVQSANDSKAYDWNDLLKQRIINDTVGSTPVVLVLENDNVSFHVWKGFPKLTGEPAVFSLDATTQTLKDDLTSSTWNMKGECIDGPLKGKVLENVPAYQEFWHSWETFHPETSRYVAK